VRGKPTSLLEAVRRNLDFGHLPHLGFQHRHHQGILVFLLALLISDFSQDLPVDSKGVFKLALVSAVVN
jgi:hypothetical protein